MKGLAALRTEVRGFLAEQLEAGSYTPTPDAWLTAWSPDFSRAMAARGWIGMTLPVEYGGHGRSHTERFVVTEEVLIAGAPVAAHWVADRQAGPNLMRFGSERQKRDLLPKIAKGELFFAIGMSEPDAGSDLSSVRTRAQRVGDGWRVSGTKVWTSGAHHADLCIVLARTSGQYGDRHRGLSQLLVDLRAPGVTVGEVTSMDGRHHFNEVVLDEVLVSDDRLLGVEGEGWKQVTAELAFERSGPERFLSMGHLTSLLIDGVSDGSIEETPELGRMLARLVGLHHMSYDVSRRLQDGEPADVAAAMVKVLGTSTEGDLVELADQLVDGAVGRVDDGLREAVVVARNQRPGFTLRGGTNEILRGIISKEIARA